MEHCLSSAEKGMNDLSEKTSLFCGACQRYYEEKGYLSESSACAECWEFHNSQYLRVKLCYRCLLEKCDCDGSFQCAYCPERFSSTLLLQKHTFVHFEGSKSLQNRFKDNDKVTKCSSCGENFILFDSARHVCYTRHMCHLCGGSLSSPYNLKVHLMKHSGNLPHKCHICGKPFSKPSELSRHERVHSGIKPAPVKIYPCELCSKTFSRPADLRRHTLTHSGTRPFACSTCGLAFSDTSNLKKHIATHKANGLSDAVSYHCSYCDRTFFRPSELKRHISVHTESRHLVCDFCGLDFSGWSNLRKHIRSHAESGLTDCLVCQATFESFEQLESHVAQHNPAEQKVDGVRCAICGKTFSSEVYLNEHMAGHTENRPFPCPECDKTFKSSSHLKNHILTHGAAKDQVCSVCRKAFLTKSSLRRHLTIHNKVDRFSLSLEGSHPSVQYSEGSVLEEYPKSSSSPAWGDLCTKPTQSADSRQAL